MLLKTSKVTDLATIWDKTTKIAYGDTTFADQNLLTTSSATFSGYANNAPSYVQANPWIGVSTTTRANAVSYQNLSGKNIMVYVEETITGNAIASTNYCGFYIGSTSANTRVGFFTNSPINQNVVFTVMVPAGWYYQIVVGGVVTLNTWSEAYV